MRLANQTFRADFQPARGWNLLLHTRFSEEFRRWPACRADRSGSVRAGRRRETPRQLGSLVAFVEAAEIASGCVVKCTVIGRNTWRSFVEASGHSQRNGLCGSSATGLMTD